MAKLPQTSGVGIQTYSQISQDRQRMDSRNGDLWRSESETCSESSISKHSCNRRATITQHKNNLSSILSLTGVVMKAQEHIGKNSNYEEIFPWYILSVFLLVFYEV